MTEEITLSKTKLELLKYVAESLESTDDVDDLIVMLRSYQLKKKEEELFAAKERVNRSKHEQMIKQLENLYTEDQYLDEYVIVALISAIKAGKTEYKVPVISKLIERTGNCIKEIEGFTVEQEEVLFVPFLKISWE